MVDVFAERRSFDLHRTIPVVLDRFNFDLPSPHDRGDDSLYQSRIVGQQSCDSETRG